MSVTTTIITGTVVSSVRTTPTPTTAQCGATLYNIPAPGAACAMAYGGNHTAILSACCKSADTISYADDCGLYCLAQGQSVSDLTACMFEHGAPWSEVFCNGAGNDTAEASEVGAPLSKGASVVAATSASATASGARATGSGSGGGAESAAGERMGMGVSGVAVSGLLLVSVLLGALQL